MAISLNRHVARARCRRVLVSFRIEHWFVCVRHGPVVISFCVPLLPWVPAGDVAASSQRLFGSSFSADFSGTCRDRPHEPLSEDLAPFSDDVPLPPAPSCFVCDGHLASSGPLSRCVLQCCSIPIHVQCVTDLVHESSQSVICPVCNAQSSSSADFLHFWSSIHGIFLQCALLP